MSTSRNTSSDKLIDARSLAPLLLTAALTTFLAWVVLIRPAQNQIAVLGLKCDQLTKVVKDLGAQSPAVDKTKGLLQHLDGLAAQVESAEASLNRFNQVHDRLAQRIARIEQTTDQIARLGHIEASVDSHRQSLDSLLASLYDLTITQDEILGSGDIVNESRNTLNLLDDLHIQLLAQHGDAEAALVTLGKLSQLSDGLAAAEQQANMAAAVAERWSIVQNTLARALPNLSGAEQAAKHAITVGTVLSGEGKQLALSQRNLDRMVAINRQLAAQTNSLNAATATITKLCNLENAVAKAASTIDTIQHMVVDICLTDPVATQAITTLRPAVEPATRSTAKTEYAATTTNSSHAAWYHAVSFAVGMLAR